MENLTKKYEIKSNGIRLDKAIADIDPDISRMTVKKLIEEEKVFVNGKKEK